MSCIDPKLSPLHSTPACAGGGIADQGVVADARASVSVTGRHHPQTPSSEEEGAFSDQLAALPARADAPPQVSFERERQVRFLEALAVWGNVRAACRAAAVSPQTAYRLRRSFAAFRLAWDAALLAARAQVEAVLADRALNGVEEAVYYHGEEVARRRRYDSRLLLAHLARLDRLAERAEVAGAADDFDRALECFRRDGVLPLPDGAADEDACEDEGEEEDGLTPSERDTVRLFEAIAAFERAHPGFDPHTAAPGDPRRRAWRAVINGYDEEEE